MTEPFMRSSSGFAGLFLVTLLGCTELLGDDFVVDLGSGGSLAAGGATTNSTSGTGGAGVGGSGGGGAAPSGGMGGEPVDCGAPGQLCCESGPACGTLSCLDGLCPEVTPLVQVPKPTPYLGTYGIDATEVTRGQYEQWLATGPTNSGPLLAPGCATNDTFVPPPTCMGLSPVCTGAGCTDHPQVCVDWCDAFAYCAAVDKKLCDHVEPGLNSHELDVENAFVNACTSGGVNDYSPGSSSEPCWTGDLGTTQVVGASPDCQSPVAGFGGVYDLTGNVAEWIDVCDSTNDPASQCNAAGGSFDEDPPYELCIYPQTWPRMDHRYVVGFRCCEL